MSLVKWYESKSWVGSGRNRSNEDYAIVWPQKGCAVLTDGATGLTKVNLIQKESDAAWYARELSLAIGEHMPQASDAQTALRDAGASVARRYLELDGAKDLKKADLPNGSVGVVTWTETLVSIYLLGDCTAVVGLRDRSTVTVHDATLDRLDHTNYELMHAYATKHGSTMAQARIALNKCFIRNRLKMNRPDGYWAADISCRGFGHELVRRFGLQDVAFVFVCSDGFAQAVDMGVEGCVETLARRVAAGEGSELGRVLRAAEQRDAGCWRVHRSKTSDDATYLVVRFA